MSAIEPANLVAVARQTPIRAVVSLRSRENDLRELSPQLSPLASSLAYSVMMRTALVQDPEFTDLKREYLILKSEISAFRMHLAARLVYANGPGEPLEVVPLPAEPR